MQMRFQSFCSSLLQRCEQPSLIPRTVSPSFHSLVMPPKVEPSTPLPAVHPPTRPSPDFPPPVSPVHHTNPFSRSQSTPPPISACNPFFSLLQQNPFYGDLLTARPLKPSPPPLPYLSGSRPPISHLFPQTNDPHATPTDSARIRSDTRSDGTVGAEERPLPPTPAPSNPFAEPDSQWDDSFEAFAAGRLQPPQGLTAEGQTQRDTRGSGLSGRCRDGGALLPSARDTPRESGSDTRSSTSRLANATVTHADGCPLFLETIPEHNDNLASENPDFPLQNSAHTEQNQANSDANAQSLNNANMDPGCHRAPAGKPSSSSPDPASSGIGSSVEEDFLSCLSSYSDKFSASSAEESEAQTLEADMMGFEKSWESTRKSKPWESDEDRSNEPSLLGAEHRSGEVLEGSPAPWRSPGATRHQPVVAAARLQPKSKENERREGFHLSAEGFPAAEVVVSAPPDVLEPAFHIRTSSPEVKQSSAGLPTGGGFPVSPESSFHNLLLPQSDSRFLRSLYVSSDSQHYQTCESLWPSGCSGSSEPDQTLRGCLLTAAQELFPDAPAPPLEETLPRRSLECSPRGFGLKDGCGLAELLPEPRRSRFPGEAAHAVPGDTSDGPPALQRSLSEGSLRRTPSSAHLPPPPASAPLTPDPRSSPVALRSLPPLAGATARSPPSTPQAAAPKPVSLESQQQQRQQQAANQRNR